ncbi:MAG: zinc metallopeptidase [Anaerolineae bacterium]|nr:zinc metallopeptidase [Anaerolineae bacterium]
MFWDPMYFIFGLPALLLALYAQWRVSAAYRKYLQVPNAMRITGLQAAQTLLRSAGLSVRVERVPGQLTDHYDPRNKVLRLSSDVERSASVGAVAIVAHEVGHAVQDAQAFALLRLRSGLVPVVNFTSWLGPILFMVGLMFNSHSLALAGVFFFASAVVFALVTLPVELDASRRAMQLLEQSYLLTDADGLRGARQVLSAAALTYVAALAQALSTMLYYLSILGGGRRRRQ